jgi:hypothetical protein
MGWQPRNFYKKIYPHINFLTGQLIFTNSITVDAVREIGRIENLQKTPNLILREQLREFREKHPQQNLFGRSTASHKQYTDQFSPTSI